jgi:HlyD family secretion protein
MDRVIPKKTWTTRRIAYLGGGLALAGLIAFSIASTTGKAKLNVDNQRLTVSEVKKAAFQEFIPVNGVVLPITTIYMDATEGGRVEEKFVEDGTVLQKGQPILRLINTDLELDLANRETAVFDLITNMQRTRNEALRNTIDQLRTLAEVDNALAEASRIHALNKKLYEQKAMGSQEYQQALNNYNFQQRRKNLIQQTLRQDSLNTKQQLLQMQQSIDRTQVALGLMRKKAGDLTVKSPVAGQLTSLNAEIGESKTRGQRLGQIDVLNGFKIRADIDEHYISRVFAGLEAEFSFAGKDYKLTIKKIYSQVTNGRFQVDMAFSDKVPEGIRRGQTMQIRLALGDETQAVLLAKGGFYQQTGGNWVFKVSQDGTKAYKVNIQLGRQNPEYYEVLEGLNVGDKVVTSSYENYGEMQELVIGGNK